MFWYTLNSQSHWFRWMDGKIIFYGEWITHQIGRTHSRKCTTTTTTTPTTVAASERVLNGITWKWIFIWLLHMCTCMYVVHVRVTQYQTCINNENIYINTKCMTPNVKHGKCSSKLRRINLRKFVEKQMLTVLVVFFWSLVNMLFFIQIFSDTLLHALWKKWSFRNRINHTRCTTRMYGAFDVYTERESVYSNIC